MAEFSSKQQSKQTDKGPFEYNQAVEKSICRPPLGYVVNSHQIQHMYPFPEDIKAYTTLLDSLEYALSKPLFCCGGSLPPEFMDKFVLKVKPTVSEVDEETWKEFKLTNLPLDELFQYCNPAPFGDLKEMKTVLDSEVRMAYEVESERFKIERKHVFKSTPIRVGDIPGSTCIKNHIEDVLTPGRIVNLDCYKLNIYSEGGFFKPHVDSPSGEEMTGTLVLCLPSPHRGGELCVNHDGFQHVFDFSKHSADTSRVQWAAFYSDCIHEVKPVLEGHRVTVTYKITLPEFRPRGVQFRYKPEYGVSSKEHFEASAESPSLTAKALANVNSELEKIREQGRKSPSRIGFLLKHKYISGGLQQRLLKGEDKALFDFLIQKQWKCKLMSVLSRYQTTDVYPHGPFEDGDLDESHEIYEFNPLSSAPVVSVHDAPPAKRSRQWETRKDFRQWRVGIPFVDNYRTAGIGEQRVRNNEGSGRWLGNNVEDVGVDKIYLESAVIVELFEEP